MSLQRVMPFCFLAVSALTAGLCRASAADDTAAHFRFESPAVTSGDVAPLPPGRLADDALGDPGPGGIYPHHDYRPGRCKPGSCLFLSCIHLQQPFAQSSRVFLTWQFAGRLECARETLSYARRIARRSMSLKQSENKKN